MDFILLWHKITYRTYFKKAWLIKVNLTKLYSNLMLHKSKRVHSRLPTDDDMRVDPSDVTLSSLSFPFIDTKSPNLA